MNNIFSPNRFSLFAMNYLGENWKRILYMSAAMLGTFIFFSAIYPILAGAYLPNTGGYLSNIGHDPMLEKELWIFWSLTYVFSASIAGESFISYRNNTRRYLLLTLPASTLEKYLTYILFNVIYSVAFCLVSIFIADTIRVLTVHLYANNWACIEPLSLKYLLTFGNVDIKVYDELGGLNQHAIDTFYSRVKILTMFGVMGLLFIQSFFFLSSSIWPKYGKIKALSFGLAIIIGCTLLVSWGEHTFLGNFWDAKPRIDHEPNVNVVLTISYVVSILITLFNYSIAYLRFKELETIDRW